MVSQFRDIGVKRHTRVFWRTLRGAPKNTNPTHEHRIRRYDLVQHGAGTVHVATDVLAGKVGYT